MHGKSIDVWCGNIIGAIWFWHSFFIVRLIQRMEQLTGSPAMDRLPKSQVPTVDGGATVKSYQLYRDVWNSGGTGRWLPQFLSLFNFMKQCSGRGTSSFFAKLRLVMIGHDWLLYPLFERDPSKGQCNSWASLVQFQEGNLEKEARASRHEQIMGGAKQVITSHCVHQPQKGIQLWGIQLQPRPNLRQAGNPSYLR